MDSREIAEDLSSQQQIVNQLREKLKSNEHILKGRENEFQELQTKFNKLKFLHKSKTTSTPESSASPSKSSVTEDKGVISSEMTDSANRGKFLLIKKQLEECRALINRQELEKSEMKKEIEVLREKQIEYEEERDVEIISANETQSTDYSTSGDSVNELFSQIVYKDTKIMEMNQKICDLEARIMDLQENLKEQNEVMQARNRAIKVLLSQQTSGSNVSFDEVVQREEVKERVEKLKERVAELEMEKGSLQLRVMELEGTNGSKPPLFDIELERDSLRAERDDLKVKYTEIIAKFDSMELQKDKIISDKEKLSTEVRKMKDLINNIEREKEKFQLVIEELNNNLSANEQKFKSINSEFNVTKAQLTDKESEIETVRQQMSELARKSKTIINEKESIISDLRIELDKRSDDLSSEKDEIIDDLGKEVDKYKNENWDLVNVNQDIKAVNQELENKLKAIQTEFESQKSSFAELTAIKDNIESDKQIIIQKHNNDFQVIEIENFELKSKLDSSLQQVSEFEQKYDELLVNFDKEKSQLISKIEILSQNLNELEINNEKFGELEELVKTQTERLSALETQKSVLEIENEKLNQTLESEKYSKLETLETLEKIQNKNYSENQLIAEKVEQIEQLNSVIEEYETQIDIQKSTINEYFEKQEESSAIIQKLELDLSEKIASIEKLQSVYSENQSEVNNNLRTIEQMENHKRELEGRLEEAKFKNQALVNQLENLIDVAERENKEKEHLKQLVERLQNENFVESDLIREKDNRIESLQKEIRKQVEDMQEIEELLTEKQNEIEILNNDIVLVQNEKQSVQKRYEELENKIKSFESEKSAETSGYNQQIDTLNTENDSLKNEINVLSEKLREQMNELNQKFKNREEENFSTIEELRKQLETQEIKLNEAMNELMSKSDENTEINLLHNELQILRETLIKSENDRQIATQDHQQLVSQLDSSVNEYKALLNEARNQIDRLEAEKLSAIQQTNDVNQVLETERENQNIVVNQNQQLKQQLLQMESQLEDLRSQNQIESVQNDSINRLNQTIDDLHKENTELKSSLDSMRLYSNEVQNSGLQQLQEVERNLNNEKLELNNRLSEMTNNYEKLKSDKEGFENAYYEMENRCQQMDQILQNQNFELNNLRENQSSGQKLSQSLSNLNEEKEHLLKVLREKENSLEVERKQNEELIQKLREKEELEKIIKEKDDNYSSLNSQISSINELNSSLQKTSEGFVEREFKYNTRIEELEKEVEELTQRRSDDDNKMSELEYELDILKRNYNLEIDSFGTTVTEREAFIERLQKKVESFKEKLRKSENMVKEYVEKEEYFKTKLNESQAMVQYEQIQRQSTTDSRIHELQQRLDGCEKQYQLEIMNLKADNSNLAAVEADLRRTVEQLENNRIQQLGSVDVQQEINNYRSHIESLVNQLEAERIEKKQYKDLYDSNIGEKTFQINNMLAEIEVERQQQSVQKHDLELKCKKFAAKFKVKEREVLALEEKLRIAKENASKNVNEEDLIDSNKKIEVLQKKVEDLLFTATNLDSALQSEREKRRQLETEKQTFWGQSRSQNLSAVETDPQTSSSSFSLFIDEENGDKSKLHSVKRFVSKQRHFLMRGPINGRVKRVAIIGYLLLIHLYLLKTCLL